LIIEPARHRLRRRLTGIDLVLVIVLSVLAIWFYIGFYFPGSYMLSYGSMPTTIMWSLRVLLPFLYAGVIALYINLRLRRTSWKELALLCASLAVGLSLCYGIANALYQRWFDGHRQEYHPYLQLMPPIDRRLDGTSSHALRIFCLGGSTTEFPDQSGRDWPSRVEGILRERYDLPNVEVYNLGRGWYTSLHTLINYETNLRQYRPSVILLMQSLNDLLQNADFSYMSHGTFREDYGHFYGPVNRIINRRDLWHYLSDVFEGVWYAVERKPLTTDRFPGLTAYERNVKTIIELARHDSTKVILMTEPCLMKKGMSEEELSVVEMIQVEAINDTMVWSSETVVNGMEQYNDLLRSIARQEHLPLIDLEEEVPKSLVFFRDEVHYQDTTFSLIAPVVAQHLFESISSKDLLDH
jgi:hypothetical protein